ncbi:CPBP family intramembrane metalloprotease [candidate division KSB1 bacterium]|nr:CPBP family intramembrane metalloprotease [candidate division KSB1 bacterium]
MIDLKKEFDAPKITQKILKFFYVDRIFARSGYLLTSRTPLYGVLSTIPLLLAYEIMTLFVGNYELYYVRNFSDIIFKELLDLMGIHGPFAFGLLIIVIVTIIFYLREKNFKKLNLKYFLWIILESGLYAVIIGYISSKFTQILFLIINIKEVKDVGIMLSLGAGFYEELVFRVLFFGISAYTLILLKVRPYMAYLAAALFSSILFSWSHYLGGENFTIISAFYRFFMGLLLCVLYKLRGFGVIAYTHAIYDLMIILHH